MEGGQGWWTPDPSLRKRRQTQSSASENGSSPMMISPDLIKKEKRDPDEDLTQPSQAISEGLQFLTVAGVKLKAEKRTVVTAFVYFHRYLTQLKSDGSEKYQEKLPIQDIIAATCYSISRKANEDINFTLNDVINVFYVMCNPNADCPPDESKVAILKNTITEFELELMHQIRFNLNVEIPHFYLLSYLKYLNNLSTMTRTRIAAYNEAACRILDDFYYNPNCIRYDAEPIAIAVLMFMIKTLPLELRPNEQTSHLHWGHFFSGSTENFVLYREIELEIINTYSLV